MLFRFGCNTSHYLPGVFIDFCLYPIFDCLFASPQVHGVGGWVGVGVIDGEFWFGFWDTANLVADENSFF